MATKKGDWTRFAELKASKGDDIWNVDINPEGKFRCSCKSFIFSKIQPKACKHTRWAVDQLAAEVRTGKRAPIASMAPPLTSIAQSMVDAMWAAANKKMTTHTSATASAIMVEVLAAKLALFNPMAAAEATVMTTAIGSGIRRITFDD